MDTKIARPLPAQCLHLRSIGEVYLPRRFADVVSDDASPRLFGPKELDQLDRIFNHLRRGGIAVTSGEWDRILGVFSYLEKKKRELAVGPPPTKEERRHPTYRKRSHRWYERHYQDVLSRVMVIAHDDQLPYVDPPIHIPYLLQLLGDPPGADGGLPFLIPVSAIQKLRSDMKQTYYVSALEGDIVAHSNVLAPLSQDTVELFQEGLEGVKEHMPQSMDALDMGCGSGVLSLLAAKVFAHHHIRVLATDVLPEAIATTKLNVERFIEVAKLPPDIIKTTNGGDLFGPVGDRRFDIIIFNAPWVVSRPRSSAEIAIYDAEQGTVRRFLMESPQHLNEGGHIILGYSDHSGLRMLENLENFIRNAGFKINDILKRRIQSRCQKRKWETILVYDLNS